ncbi:DUF6538 domain-containing protein [Nisaea sp.]|uniref:DUF6538 domain-containing protein n=1 Tax=Nisaea sp. TaxID=2024842 RepID=UPI002B26AF55|nr:DUF6538 domain-containing protein [Nisaea sp.]
MPQADGRAASEVQQSRENGYSRKVSDRLQRRGNGWRFRAVVPRDLRRRMGKREVVRSLGRCSQQTARRLARLLSAAWERFLREVREHQSLTAAEIQELARRWLAEAIEEEDRVLASFRPNDPSDRQRAVARSKKQLDGARTLAFEVHDIGLVAEDAIEMLQKVGVTDPSKDTINQLCDLLLRANVELVTRTVARLKGDVWKGVADPVFESGPQPATTSMTGDLAKVPANALPQARTVGELATEYIQREVASTTGTKNVQKATAHLRSFTEIIGPRRPISSLERSDLSDFRHVLESLPTNVTKLFPDRALRDVAEMNHKRPTLSPTSVNQSLIRVGAFLTWCRDHGYTDKDLSTSRLKMKKPTRSKKARTPFTVDELEALFSGPRYSGCKSRSRRNAQGDLIIRDGTYFLPLLGLLTGARLGELLGLTPKDIDGDPGQRVILIRPNGLRGLKNEESDRLVPLHSVLEELGFDIFLRAQKVMNRSIFGAMAKRRGGNITDNESRRFSTHLSAIGIKRPKLSFHSFRHLFEDLGKASGVPEDLRRALLGQAQKGMGNVYGGVDGGFTVEQRRRAIESLVLPLDLKQLVNLAQRPGKRLIQS